MVMTWTVSVGGGPRRVNHAGVLIGSRIYSFGGYCAEEAELMDDLTHKIPIDVTVLDTRTYRWIRQAMPGCHQEQFYQSPFQRYGHTVVAYKGKAYLWGGRADSMGSCNKLYEYDPGAHRFFIVEPSHHEAGVPGSRDGHTAAVYKDDMIIYGGYVDNDSSYGREVYAFHFPTRRWRQIPTTGEAPTERDFHSATIVGSRMYVFGGRSDEFSPVPFSHEYYCDRLKYLDLETLEWKEVSINGPLKPCGRRSHSAWEYEGKLYLFGGYNGTLNTHLCDLYRFDPETNAWEELKPTGQWPCPRRRQVVVQVAHRVFVFGGTTSGMVTPTATFSEHLPFRLATVLLKGPGPLGDAPAAVEEDLALVDLDDLHVLDLSWLPSGLCRGRGRSVRDTEPTLYELASRAVLEQGGTTCLSARDHLPREIWKDLENKRQPNHIPQLFSRDNTATG